MSYAELSTALNAVALEKRLLTEHEVKCISKSLENPFLKAMLQQYPLLHSAQILLQNTLTQMEQEAAQRAHQNTVPVPTYVHAVAFADPRSRTAQYLQQHFPATKKTGLMEKLEGFMNEFLNLDKYPDVRQELELAERSRDTERKRAVEEGRLSEYIPPKSIEEIKEDFGYYISHLKNQYTANTTFVWDVLESLFKRMDNLESPVDKDTARNTLILALDDARAAYDLLQKKYVRNTDFTCQKGLEERLLDHHQLIVFDIQSNFKSRKETIQALMSPFAKIDSQDIENGGIARYIYTSLLYQLYAQAAGYRFEPQTKQIYKLKDSSNVEDLFKKYLKSIEKEPAKSRAIKCRNFDTKINQLKKNLLEPLKDDNNAVIIFLNEEKALEQQEHTEIELLAPEIIKTEEEILSTMVAEGPFIDRAHLDAVLAWHDRNASTATMRDSLEAGLEPSVTEDIPSKESMIAAYDSYVQNQLNIQPVCQLDFMHGTLEGMLIQGNLHDLPCTQTVLCEYLLENSMALTQSQKGQLAILCAKQGYASSLNFLIRAGVDPDWRDDYCTSLLIWSVIRNHLDCVKILIAAGANPNQMNSMRKSALIFAIKENNTQILKYLLHAGASPNQQDWEGETAVMVAFAHQNVEFVNIFLAEGVYMNLKNHHHDTILMMVACIGHIELVRKCIAAGSDLNLQDISGFSALMMAVQNGHIEIVRTLITAGANVDLQDNEGKTALILAANRTCMSSLRMLIAAGANVNLQDNTGKTALMQLVKHSPPEIIDSGLVKILIKAGAHLFLKDDHANTAWSWAKKCGQTQAANIIISSELKQSMNFVRNRIPLLKKAPKEMSKDLALIVTAENGDHVTCRTLLETGANINFCNKDGNTALYIAIINKHSAVVTEIMRYEMTPHYLIQSINLAVENPQYHNMVPLLFQNDIAKILLSQKPDAIKWAQKYHCDAAVFALSGGRAHIESNNPFIPEEGEILNFNQPILHSRNLSATQQNRYTHQRR